MAESNSTQGTSAFPKNYFPFRSFPRNYFPVNHEELNPLPPAPPVIGSAAGRRRALDRVHVLSNTLKR